MRAKTNIGEIMISAEINGEYKDYLIKPSFENLNNLGSPDEIEYVIDNVISCMDKMSNGESIDNYTYQSCLDIIYSCAPDDIEFEIFGGWRDVDGKLEMVKGKMTPQEVIIYANHLVKWGVVGDPTDDMKSSKKNQAKEQFDPREFQALAVSHFALSTADAWGLTMAEFQRHALAKNPPDPNKKPIKQDELEQLAAHSAAAHKKMQEMKRG